MSTESHAPESRYVWLIRHAKTEGHFTKPDFQRELTARGRRDCGFMGDYIAQSPHRPELYITSPALRTLETTQLLVERAGGTVREDERLYGADSSTIEEVVREVEDHWGYVGVVGHNPGISDSVATLAGGDWTHLVTLGVAVVRCRGTWTQIKDATLVEVKRPPKAKN